MELDATQEAALRNLPQSCLCTICLNPMTGNIDDSAPVEVCQSHHHVCRGCSRSLRRRTCPECRQPVRAHFIKNVPLKRMIQELVDTALRAYEQHEQQQPIPRAAAPDAPDAGTVAALNTQVSQMQARIRQLEETNSEQAAGMEAFVDELTTNGRPSSGPVRLRAEPQALPLPARQPPAPVPRPHSRGERAVQAARLQQQQQQQREEEQRLARQLQQANEINNLQDQFLGYSMRFKDEVSLSSCRTNKRKDVTAWNAAKLCLMELDGELALYEENYNLPAVRTIFLNGPPPTRQRCQHAKAYLDEWGAARNYDTNGDAHLRSICFAIERHIHLDDLQA